MNTAELIGRLRHRSTTQRQPISVLCTEAADALDAAQVEIETIRKQDPVACMVVNENTAGHKMLWPIEEWKLALDYCDADEEPTKLYSSQVTPVPTAPTSMSFGMKVLEWNRSQERPSIQVGNELWVADEVAKMYAEFAPVRELSDAEIDLVRCSASGTDGCGLPQSSDEDYVRWHKKIHVRAFAQNEHSNKRHRHEQSMWFIAGGHWMWCYQCGAIRLSIPGSKWQNPSGIGGVNPAMNAKESQQ